MFRLRSWRLTQTLLRKASETPRDSPIMTGLFTIQQ